MKHETCVRCDRESLSQRLAVFQALVEVQDRGVDLASSRQVVAQRFGITVEDVRQIEREGLECDWPLPPVTATKTETGHRDDL
jgi:hypothetical protein